MSKLFFRLGGMQIRCWCNICWFKYNVIVPCKSLLLSWLGFIVLLESWAYSVHCFMFIWHQTLPKIQWGKNIRVILDVGCGVASFGGSLLDKNVMTMSFAPKDEHEAQIQFALERGIPATLSVIGTQKLAFPNNGYDMIHCARCRVHWEADGTSWLHMFHLFYL